MAYVYQAGVFTSIAINIGLADKQLQDQLRLVAGTAASYTKTSRDIVATSLDSSSTNANTDATTILIQAFRNTETSLSATISPFYSSTLVSLNTYFSSLWTMGTGVAFMIIRARYLSASDKIEDEIVRLKERISSRFQAISLQNRDDYRNLKLHGTILNTLIFAKNNPEFVSNRQSFMDSIKNELSELRTNRRTLQTDLHETLEDLLTRRTLKRIRVSRMEISVPTDHFLYMAPLCPGCHKRRQLTRTRTS